MMQVVLISLGFFIVFFVLMSVGLLQGKAIKGTCGGLNKFKADDGRTICEACAPDEVEKLKAKLMSST